MQLHSVGLSSVEVGVIFAIIALLFKKYFADQASIAHSSDSFTYSTPKNARVSRYNAGQQVPSRVMAATLDTPTVRTTALSSIK